MKVYLLNINALLTDFSFVAKNFPARYHNAKSFKFEDDKRRSLAVGILLYEILGITEKDIKYIENGKPVCDKIPYHFSISHSGSYAILGVSERLNGVDIEENERRPKSIMDRVLCGEEIDFCENKTDRFLSVWTLKESVSKALGLGLKLKFNRFSVLPLITGESIKINDKIFFGETVVFDNHIISAVTQDKKEKLEIITLNPEK